MKKAGMRIGHRYTLQNGAVVTLESLGLGGVSGNRQHTTYRVSTPDGREWLLRSAAKFVAPVPFGQTA